MLPSILVIPPSVVKHLDWVGYFGFPGPSPNLPSGSLPLSSNEFYDKSAFSRHTTLKIGKEKRAKMERRKIWWVLFWTVYKRVLYRRISLNFHLNHRATKSVWGEGEDKNVNNVFFKGTCVQHFKKLAFSVLSRNYTKKRGASTFEMAIGRLTALVGGRRPPTG